MSPVIRVDGQVWAWLQGQAVPFEDTPNSVLRRIAGLDPAVHQGHDAAQSAADPTEQLVNPPAGLLATASGGLEHPPYARDYVIRRRADAHTRWWFQIYLNKLDDTERHGGTQLVVVCDYESPAEKVFSIPISYLRTQVLPLAKFDSAKGRYMFTIIKASHEFIFGGVRFDGRAFLAS